MSGEALPGPFTARPSFYRGPMRWCWRYLKPESNRRSTRRLKACALARQILAVSLAYNDRPSSSDLPRPNWESAAPTGFRADLLDGYRLAHHDPGH